MPRKIPISNKRRKEQLLVKRALKRGDISVEDHKSIRSEQKLKTEKRRPGRLSSRSGGPTDSSSKKLQSKFIALSSYYITRTRDLAFSLPLERPLPPERAAFPLDILEARDLNGKLVCPTRPKFHHGQTKKEVEKNEEGMFKMWLKNMQEMLEEWVDEEIEAEEEDSVMPRGPTWFETNLELHSWRVTEASHILLLLLDSRCPPLHCPPSLRTYLKDIKTTKEVILVLTKSDLVDPKALQDWKEWINEWWGQGAQVVSVRAYDDQFLPNRKRSRPDIPQQSLDELISALRLAHQRLLQPPQWALNDPEKLKEWQLPVRPSVDWPSLSSSNANVNLTCNEQTDQTSIQEFSMTKEDVGDDISLQRDSLYEPLTIGLIGQPNVGKSSLLNALLGEQKVRASRTPGKACTKHFQTMLWGAKREVKIVDCPGLVCPSLAGSEIQALAGSIVLVIPIAQIPSLPSCILFASHHLPIEEIFRVPRPQLEDNADNYIEKRTFRDEFQKERARQREMEKENSWNIGGVLEARAIDKGYLTAKGGRPDINRAANGILRALADGKVRWGFYPPGMTGKPAKGIWLDNDKPNGGRDVEESDNEEIEETEQETLQELEEEEESETIEERSKEGDHNAKEGMKQAKGFFAALSISEGEDGQEE
nr:GTPase [Cryptococcus depauperatus CBS 7855]